MVKNGFCLAGMVFSGQLMSLQAQLAAWTDFLVFCLASSAIYILNDVVDVERDRLHPRKRDRPIASGAVSVTGAVVFGSLLAIASLVVSSRLHAAVMFTVILYMTNNLVYSLRVKHLVLFDVLSIAIGFVLRLVSGVYAVNDIPTTWITLCTFFLAVFLGFGKRRGELASLADVNGDNRRPVLSGYTVPFLDQCVNMSAVLTVTCYALFTVASHKNPSLVITVPIVFFAIMHYQRLVMILEGGEQPEHIVLRDVRIQLSLAVWFLMYSMVELFKPHFFR
jgi:4-hydroxybenzoate polyprenyltransferase